MKRCFIPFRIGDIKDIRKRIDKCENVNAKDNSGKTALHLAAKNGILSFREEILSKSPAQSILVMISRCYFTLSNIFSGHLDIVKLLVEHGAEVDVTDNFDDTPLHLAAKNGFLFSFHLK